MEQPAREGDDEAVADGIHGVDAFWERVRGLLLRGGRTGVPETDRAIPGPGNDGVCKEGRGCVRRDWEGEREWSKTKATQLASLEYRTLDIASSCWPSACIFSEPSSSLRTGQRRKGNLTSATTPYSLSDASSPPLYA
jgi:hypothetical protein